MKMARRRRRGFVLKVKRGGKGRTFTSTKIFKSVGGAKRSILSPGGKRFTKRFQITNIRIVKQRKRRKKG